MTTETKRFQRPSAERITKVYGEWTDPLMLMSVRNTQRREFLGISNPLDYMISWADGKGLEVLGTRLGFVIVVSDPPSEEILEKFHAERMKIGSYLRLSADLKG